MQINKFGTVSAGPYCSIHSYLTDEPLTDVLADGFFNDVCNILRQHDRLLLKGAEAEVTAMEDLTVCTRLLKTVSPDVEREQRHDASGNDAEGEDVPTKRGRGRPPKSAVKAA